MYWRCTDWGVLCTGAAQIEKARAVNLIRKARAAKIRSSPQHCCGSLLVLNNIITI